MKGSKFWRLQQEKIWQTTEIYALDLLAQYGVLVPQPYCFTDGVLLIELITDEAGLTTLQLCYVTLMEKEEIVDYHIILQSLVRMLLAGD